MTAVDALDESQRHGPRSDWLFHFSDRPDIACFMPRPTVAARPAGREWLNGPLVWAIDEWHSPLYFFPRDCPRILWWPTPATTAADVARWCGASTARMTACVEQAWLEPLRSATLYRYRLPSAGFEDLGDAGMWVSHGAVSPAGVDTITDLPAVLAAADVELRVLPSLLPLRDAWSTSLHVSGIRLRNAAGWPPARL
jgi:hypothetical protein